MAVRRNRVCFEGGRGWTGGNRSCGASHQDFRTEEHGEAPVSRMHRDPVKSSNIISLGYDPVAQALEIEFYSKAVYRYEGVASAEHEALISAPSIGTHFSKHFRARQCHRVWDS